MHGTGRKTFLEDNCDNKFNDTSIYTHDIRFTTLRITSVLFSFCNEDYDIIVT